MTATQRNCNHNTTSLEKELGVEKDRFMYITGQLSVQVLFLGKTARRLERRDWTDSPVEKEFGGGKGDITGLVSVQSLSLAYWIGLPIERAGRHEGRHHWISVSTVAVTQRLERLTVGERACKR